MKKIDEKQIIKIEVNGDDKPYSAYGRYFIRSDDDDLQMTNSQLEDLFVNKNLDYSKWENELTSYGEEVVDEDVFIAVRTEKGYDFDVAYYDGGMSFDEAIEEAVDNAKQ